MRHKYDTSAIVLARAHTGEATTLVTLLTADLGLVQARAQSVRKEGAKLAFGLVTLAESRVMLVHGKEGWRLTGVVLEENWFFRLPGPAAQETVGRVLGLLLRLVAGEAQDRELFPIMREFLESLATRPEPLHEAIEMLAVLRFLAALGLDTGELPSGAGGQVNELLNAILRDRTMYIDRINTGIVASGL